MVARVDPELAVTMRVAVPGRPDVPLLECLEPRRRSRRAPVPRRVVLRGEMCRYSTPFLREHLERSAADESILVDLAAVTLADSSALDICDDLSRRWSERGQTVRLTGAGPLALTVIELLGLGHLLADGATDTGGPALARKHSVGGGSSRTDRVRPSGSPVELSIKNLEGGRVIEVTAHGTVRDDRAREVKAVVDRLIRAREPGELRIELGDTTGDVDLAEPLRDASEALWSIGARLVVCHPSRELEGLLVGVGERIVVESVSR